jgi:hypothetical protein
MNTNVKTLIDTILASGMTMADLRNLLDDYANLDGFKRDIRAVYDKYGLVLNDNMLHSLATDAFGKECGCCDKIKVSEDGTRASYQDNGTYVNAYSSTGNAKHYVEGWLAD